MKKCPYCAEEIQDEAIVYRFCGRDLNKPNPVQPVSAQPAITQPIPENPQKKNNAILWLVLVIVLICIIGWAISNSNKGGGSDSSKPDKQDAQYMCEQFVKDRLKAPSTAKFASWSENTVTQLSDNEYKVYSYVDSENSFGAMIRTHYTCTVLYTGNDNWRLTDLSTE